MSLELEIGELRLAFQGNVFPQHRAADISRQAMTRLRELLQEDQHRVVAMGPGQHLATIDAEPVQADFSHAGNAEVAGLVAQAIYAALLEQLRV